MNSLCCLNKSVWILLLILIATPCANSQTLTDFQNPPQSARCLTWWHWMNGNVTQSGITNDLEAMHEAGIQGVILFNVGFLPKGPVSFMSDEWWQMVTHAIKECDRLGMKFGIFNSDGWSMSGGPWIDIKDSMKKLVWEHVTVAGGEPLELRLPQPETNQIYEDIAVLAFPKIANDAPHKVKVHDSQAISDVQNMLNDDPASTATVLGAFGDIPHVTLDFGKIRVLRRIKLDPIITDPWMTMHLRVAYSRDGSHFTFLPGKLPLNLRYESHIQSGTFNFDAVKARYVKLVFEIDTSDDWGWRRYKENPMQIGTIQCFQSPRISMWEPKSGQSKKIKHEHQQAFIQELEHAATEPLAEKWVVNSEQIINLTQHLQSNGTLKWQTAPAGEWTILRVGYTSTLRTNGPASDAGRGYECDKMSVKATRKHFEGYVKRMNEHSQQTVGKPIDFMQMESWEAGIQNWTDGFDEEFRKRCGYSIYPFLPVLADGRVVDSYIKSNAFLRDMRKTVSELMAEHYWAVMYELAAEHEITVLGEGSGNQHYLYDPIRYHEQTDYPMGEFWTGGQGYPRVDCKNAASVAHTYGKPRVAAESFTGGGEHLWRLAPFDMKEIGDEAFSMGVNQYVLHSFVHQPFEVAPGLTLDRFGNHFQRHNPWYTEARGWFDYVARCQALLRQGQFIADVAYFVGDGTPAYLGRREELNPSLPAGYDYDGFNLELLRQMKVDGNDIVLPTGMRYKALVFPPLYSVTLETLEQIERLLNMGAVVVAEPLRREWTLKGYPESVAAFDNLKKSLWQNCDAAEGCVIFESGGKLIWGQQLDQVFEQIGRMPDFSYKSGQDSLLYLHRRMDKGDLYFVSNQKASPVQANVSFRAVGAQVEFWYPDRGSVERIEAFKQDNKQTHISLKLAPYGSRFVFIRDNIDSTIASSIRLEISEIVQIETPWKVAFNGMGGQQFQKTFRYLMDWTEDKDASVKYFSGKATYTNNFDIEESKLQASASVLLDLGQVYDVVTVYINGKRVANLWKPPYSVEIGHGLRAGENTLRLDVVNTAVNQMIGDERYPNDLEIRGHHRPGIPGVQLVEWPGWLDSPEHRGSQRTTFVTYNFFDADSPLEPSGLVGPVKLFLMTPMKK